MKGGGERVQDTDPEDPGKLSPKKAISPSINNTRRVIYNGVLKDANVISLIYNVPLMYGFPSPAIHKLCNTRVAGIGPTFGRPIVRYH